MSITELKLRLQYCKDQKDYQYQSVNVEQVLEIIHLLEQSISVIERYQQIFDNERGSQIENLEQFSTYRQSQHVTDKYKQLTAVNRIAIHVSELTDEDFEAIISSKHPYLDDEEDDYQ